MPSFMLLSKTAPKGLFRLSRPEFWYPKLSTQTLLDSITVPHIIESMAVVLSKARAHGEMDWHWLELLEFV